ncbi:MAG: hypothetical protein RLZZ241_2232 [Bacteroidota bacterium]
MNLAVDVGNTQIKMGVFNETGLIFVQAVPNEVFSNALKETFARYPEIRAAILASVGGPAEDWVALISIFCTVHVVGPQLQVPYRNTYATTATLGADRMALAAAAFYYAPNANKLVVDAGSCITYDFINDFGEYLGGGISPGLRMRYRALHTFTARLPLLEPIAPEDLIGNATASSMHSGVVNGLLTEIDGIIGKYKDRYPDLTVILTGGDAHFLSDRLKSIIFANPNFLLEGLNRLLVYNTT